LGSVSLYGPFSQYTKASPAHESKRWTGTVPPCLSDTNPSYGRGIWDRLPPVFIPRGLDLDQAEFSRALCLLHEDREKIPEKAQTA
jgi:hypothetical protein